MRPSPFKGAYPSKPRNNFIDVVKYPDKTIGEDITKNVFAALSSGDNVDEIKKNLFENNTTSFFTSSGDDMRSPLHVVIENMNLNEDDKYELVNFLINTGSPIASYDANNATPLHLACKYQLYDIARILIKNGAGVNDTDNQHMTCLHYLCQGHIGKCSTAKVKSLFPTDGEIGGKSFLKKEMMSVMEFFLIEIKKKIDSTMFLHIKNTFDHKNMYDMFSPEIDVFIENGKREIIEIRGDVVNNVDDDVAIKQKINAILIKYGNQIEQMMFERLTKTLKPIDIHPDNSSGSGINNGIVIENPRRKIFPFNDVKDMLNNANHNLKIQKKLLHEDISKTYKELQSSTLIYFKSVQQINILLSDINIFAKLFYFFYTYDSFKMNDHGILINADNRYVTWNHNQDGDNDKYKTMFSKIIDTILVTDTKVHNFNLDSKNMDEIDIKNQYHNANTRIISTVDKDEEKEEEKQEEEKQEEKQDEEKDEDEDDGNISKNGDKYYLKRGIPYHNNDNYPYIKLKDINNNNTKPYNDNYDKLKYKVVKSEDGDTTIYIRDINNEVIMSDYVDVTQNMPTYKSMTEAEQKNINRGVIIQEYSSYLDFINYRISLDDFKNNDAESYFIDKTLFIVDKMQTEMKSLKSIFGDFNIDNYPHVTIYINKIVRAYVNLLNIALWIVKQEKEMTTLRKHMYDLHSAANEFADNNVGNNFAYLPEQINEKVLRIGENIESIKLKNMYNDVRQFIGTLNKIIDTLNIISGNHYMNEKTPQYFQKRLHSLKDLPDFEDFVEMKKELPQLKIHMFETYIPQMTSKTYTMYVDNIVFAAGDDLFAGDGILVKAKAGFLIDPSDAGIIINDLTEKNTGPIDESILVPIDATKFGNIGNIDDGQVGIIPPTTIYSILDEHINYLRTKFVLDESNFFINSSVRNTFKNKNDILNDDAYIDSAIAKFIDMIAINNIKLYISNNVKKIVKKIIGEDDSSDSDITLHYDNNDFKISLAETVNIFYSDMKENMTDIGLIKKYEKKISHETVINNESHECLTINTDIIDLLVKHGCDVNKRDIIGATAIYYCIMNENMSSVKKLIAMGSFVKKTKTRNNLSPYDILKKQISKIHDKILTALDIKSEKALKNNIIYKLLGSVNNDFRIQLVEDEKYKNNVLRSTYEILPMFVSLINYNFLKMTINTDGTTDDKKKWTLDNKNKLFEQLNINNEQIFTLGNFIDSDFTQNDPLKNVVDECEFYLTTKNDVSNISELFKKNIDDSDDNNFLKDYQSKWKTFMNSNDDISPMYIHLMVSRKIAQILKNKNIKKNELDIFRKWYEVKMKPFYENYNELEFELGNDDDSSINKPLHETYDILLHSMRYTLFASLYHTIHKVVKHYVHSVSIKKKQSEFHTLHTALDPAAPEIHLDGSILSDIDDKVKDIMKTTNMMEYIINDMPPKIIKSKLKLFDGPYDPAQKVNVDSLFDNIIELLKTNNHHDIDDLTIITKNLKNLIFPYFKNYIEFFVNNAKIFIDKYYASIISEAKNIQILLDCIDSEN